LLSGGFWTTPSSTCLAGIGSRALGGSPDLRAKLARKIAEVAEGLDCAQFR
jgi:hypothetical protein